MNYIYTAVLEPQESGSYFVTVPDLPQVATRGADLKDALDMGNDALALWLTYAEEQGLAVPKATPPGVIKAEAPAFTTLFEADTDAYRRAYPPETWARSARSLIPVASCLPAMCPPDHPESR